MLFLKRFFYALGISLVALPAYCQLPDITLQDEQEKRRRFLWNGCTDNTECVVPAPGKNEQWVIFEPIKNPPSSFNGEITALYIPSTITIIENNRRFWFKYLSTKDEVGSNGPFRSVSILAEVNCENRTFAHVGGRYEDSNGEQIRPKKRVTERRPPSGTTEERLMKEVCNLNQPGNSIKNF